MLVALTSTVFFSNGYQQLFGYQGSFVFSRRKKLIQVWNNMRVSKSRQLYFCGTFPLRMLSRLRHWGFEMNLYHSHCWLKGGWYQPLCTEAVRLWVMMWLITMIHGDVCRQCMFVLSHALLTAYIMATFSQERLNKI